MKKLLAAVVALGIAGSASASAIDFSFGTNFYKPHADVYEGMVENGQCFLVSWNLDSDISLGVYNELSSYDFGGETLAVTAVQATKGIVKNVAVGINLGGADPTDGTPGALVDILGTVKILSGSGDKIEGAVTATAAARFSKADLDGGRNYVDGVNLILAVLLGF